MILPIKRPAIALIAALAAMLALASCQTSGPSAALDMTNQRTPTVLMLALARNAQKCWFSRGETAFAAYRLADEVNSLTGRPRFLLVPRSNPAALPLLVVQAEPSTAAGPAGARLQAYGPLLSTAKGRRITDDVQRWSTGNADC